MLKVFSTVALCLAGTSMALAHGAVIQDKVGVVLVNSGKGFFPVDEGTVLAPTDVVSIKPHGTAFLVYKDGCRTKLKAGRTVTVGSTACAEGRELADLPERAPVPESAPVPVAPLDPGAPLIGGVLVTAAGVGTAIALSNHNDMIPPTPTRPVSP